MICKTCKNQTEATECKFRAGLHDNECEMYEFLFVDKVDTYQRDVARTINNECNNSEHQRLYERRGV